MVLLSWITFLCFLITTQTVFLILNCAYFACYPICEYYVFISTPLYFLEQIFATAASVKGDPPHTCVIKANVTYFTLHTNLKYARLHRNDDDVNTLVSLHR